MFAKVVVNVNHKKVDKIYTYKIDSNEQNDVVGTRCIVPFGRSNKEIFGIIVDVCEEIDFDINKCKSVIKILDDKPLISRKSIETALIMHKDLYCTRIECLNLFMPRGSKTKIESVIILNDTSYEIDNTLTKKEAEVVEYIKSRGNKVIIDEVQEALKDSKKAIDSLQAKNIIEIKNISEVKNVTQKVTFAAINYENENIEDEIDIIQRKVSKQNEVVTLLQKFNKLSVPEIKGTLKISDSPIKTLQKNGILTLTTEEVMRNPELLGNYKGNKVKEYTSEQKNAIDKITKKIDEEKFSKPFLLHGVTGSGKTEIYLKCVEEVIKKGQQAIILVPEISLTSQIVNIFVSRFEDKVSVTHSRLSAGERYDQYRRAKNGDVSIMIGPRSALFTPFSNIGIIIIDEEHDSSYRSDTSPKYTATDVASIMCKLNNAQLVLGSATPKVESYYKALNGEYELIELKNRVNNSFPNIEIVDMAEELRHGNKTIFSARLVELMTNAVNNDEQVILFLNKRGYSSFVNCRSCGEVIKCDSCDIAMTYHAYKNKLQCHYCNKIIKNPERCPVCGSKYIKHFGLGTQRIEEDILKVFPNEKVIRMDSDTTSGKNSHEILLQNFRDKKAKFLVGTQMIAKGLDFNDVTVVGIVAADLSLNANEYLATETTFGLINQVAGRAGRSKKKGNVIVQTYKPDHFVLNKAKENDYLGFYENEIEFRKFSNNPPFVSNMFINATCTDEKRLSKALVEIQQLVIKYKNEVDKKELFTYSHFEVIGPAPSPMVKIRKRYRWRLLVKCDNKEMCVYVTENAVEYAKEKMSISDINLSLNLNPESIN